MSISTIDLSAPASEINALIERTTADYIAFVDASPKETDSSEGAPKKQPWETYFSHLAEVLSEHADCAIACGAFRTHKGKPLSFESKLPKDGPKRFDVKESFYRTRIYPYGMLVDAKALRDAPIRFDEQLTYCRDELFTAQLMDRFGAYLYVPESTYQATVVLDETSVTTPQASVKEWYWDSTLPLLDALTDDAGDLSKAAQFTLLYLIIQRYKSNEDMNIKIVFDDREETNRYIAEAQQVLQHISDDVLFTHKARLWERRKLLYLAELRNGKEPLTFDMTFSDNEAKLKLKGSASSGYICGLANQTLRIQALRYTKDETGRPGFDIDFRFETCFPPEILELHLVNSWENGSKDCLAERTKRIGGLTQFFDYEAYTIPSYHVFVPFAPGKVHQAITAYAVVNGKKIVLKHVIPWYGWQSRLVNNDPYAYWAIPHYLVRSTKAGIDVTPAHHWTQRRAEKDYQNHLAKEHLASKRMQKLRKDYWKYQKKFKNKRIWLYYDKGFKGGDNGEYAFRYAAEQNDGIDHVYLIARDSEDGKRLIAAGYHILEPGSKEAILYALFAEVIFATHVPVYRKVGLNKKNVLLFKDLMQAKIIRLYHGFPITRDISYTQPYADYTAVAVGSRYERDLYTNEDNGFRPDQIIPCSMPRYDGLISESHRQILFAPTWRPSCRGEVSKNGESLYNPEFIHSRYFERYNHILNDERLLETARKTGYKIKMFLHPRMAPQTVDFKPNDVVEALDCTKDTDYVTIMRQSDLMITDYSSVMVDFAYMRKPVVYYQDPALPYWRATNFDYEGIGFGEVCQDADTLVTILCDYMERDCTLKDLYRKRINDFFFYDDFKGAERLYQAVRKLTD